MSNLDTRQPKPSLAVRCKTAFKRYEHALVSGDEAGARAALQRFQQLAQEERESRRGVAPVPLAAPQEARR